MTWIDIICKVLWFILWAIAPYAWTTATCAYSVGFFVGCNKLDWTPECTEDAGRDRWFAFWARVGLKRGAKAK